MRPKIKVCGITRPEDALMALELGADFIGMIRYRKSPRYVEDAALREILSVVPPGRRVFVDVATGTDELEDYLHYQFDAYQLHFDLEISLATVAAWSGIVGQHALWLAPRIPPKETRFPQVLLEFADTILLDAFATGHYGGSGVSGTNWTFYSDCAVMFQHKRWILAGGLSADTVREAVRVTGAEMLDVNSGVESQPGIKSRAKLEALFAAFD